MSNETETVTVIVELFGRKYTTAVEFRPDGLNDEKHIAEATASSLGAAAATDGNLSLPCLMAELAESDASPSILQAAGWAYRCTNIDDTGNEGWEIKLTAPVYTGFDGFTPNGVDVTCAGVHSGQGGSNE
jgi:hypothetical protein